MREFVDSEKAFRWVNTTTLDTESLEIAVNRVIADLKAHFPGRFKAQELRHGCRVITIRESRALFSMRAAGEMTDSFALYVPAANRNRLVVWGASFYSPEIKINPRSNWYGNEIEALAAGDSKNVPEFVVRQLMSAFASAFLNTRYDNTATKMRETMSSLSVADVQLGRKTGQGEISTNVFLRFRAIRQAEKAGYYSRRASRMLSKAAGRMTRFEMNGVPVKLTEEEKEIIDRAEEILWRVGEDAKRAATKLKSSFSEDV